MECRGLLLDLSQILWEALGRLSYDSLNETAEGESSALKLQIH